MGIVEKKDVNGDVVNVSQRFESLASPHEVLISEETYTPIKEKEEFTIVHLKETSIKGKSGPQKVYKVLWIPEEIEKQKSGGALAEGKEEVTGVGAKTSDFNLDEIKKLATEAKMTVKRKGSQTITYDLSADPKILGRSSKAEIVIPEQYVSRQHAKIYKEKGSFFIEDLKSHVGLLFDGNKVSKQKIKNGDAFQIGSVTLSFEVIKKETTRNVPLIEESQDETLTFEPGNILQLVLKEQNRDKSRFELTNKPLIIGREEGCGIRLQSPMVSRRHAKVFAKNGVVYIEDLGSNNGTYIAGKKMTKGEATHGTTITIGPFAIEVQDPMKPKPDSKAKSAGPLTIEDD